MGTVEIIPVSQAHLIDLMNIRNEENVRKELRQVGWCFPEGQTRWLEGLIKDPNRYVFSILLDGVVVGSCGLLDIDWVKRHAEISNFICKKAQGQRVGYTACRKLMKFAFEELGLQTIYGFVLATNKRAIEFNKKIGQKITGTFRERKYVSGKWIDEILFDMTKKDYYDSLS